MPDKKISELPALTGANAATGDLLPIVDISAVETKSITRGEFFSNLPALTITGGSITGITDLAVADGGTGTSTLTGYVKGAGTTALTASATIPNTDVTGLGTLSTQAASAVSITGGSINGTTVGGTTRAAVNATTLSANDASSVTANSASAALTITQTGAGNAIVVEDSASPDSTPFVVNAAGQVGIGLSSPAVSLDIGGTGNPSLRLLSTTNTVDFRVQTVGASSTAGIGTVSNHSLTLSTFNGERMRILGNGNVGIGTSTPIAPLHVIGNTITTGVVFKNQPAQTTKAAAATLTIAELLTGIVQYTGAAATLTLPTGTDIETGLPATFPVDMSFDISVINTGSGTATLGTATGLTLVGSMAVTTAAAGSAVTFRFRKTALNTYTVYRVS